VAASGARFNLPGIRRARDALGRVFYQRCFYLFFAQLALITAAPLMEFNSTNRILFNALQAFVLVAAIAAVGRGLLPFMAASLVALPAIGFQVLGLWEADAEDLLTCWAFTAGFYALVLGYLLRYVFRDDVMTADKLYGAAAAYLMLAVLWGYLYMVAQALQPGAFSIGGAAGRLEPRDIIYFSVTVLTSTGFGDIVPLRSYARTLVMLQQLSGVLFIAILIARLAGVYPVRKDA
jgi:hypothetical protein